MQAKWAEYEWGYTKNALRSIEKLRLECGLNISEEKSKRGARKIVIKGKTPQTISLEYSTGFKIGIDSRDEFEKFKNLAGKTSFFYLGDVRVGDARFILDSVTLGGCVVTPDGKILYGKNSLVFSQNVAAPINEKKEKKDRKKKAQTPIALKKQHAKGGINSIKSGLNIGPNKEEKARAK